MSDIRKSLWYWPKAFVVGLVSIVTVFSVIGGVALLCEHYKVQPFALFLVPAAIGMFVWLCAEVGHVVLGGDK